MLPRFHCDFCTRSTLKPMVNIGTKEEKIFACTVCIRDKKLLNKVA